MATNITAMTEPKLTGAAWLIDAINSWSERWIPSSFSLACLLTLLSFAAVLIVGHKTAVEALGYWNQGFWHLLELAMQMSLVLLTGYIVAVSPLISKGLGWIAELPRSGRAVVGLMAFGSMLLSWTHWGLGLVGAPIFMRF